MAYSAAPDTLDPQATLNISTQQYSTMVFDNLTSLDEKKTALPNLALQWTPEKQGQEWVFDLRQGVHFHHGTRVQLMTWWRQSSVPTTRTWR